MMEALTGNKPKKTDIRMIALDLDGTLRSLRSEAAQLWKRLQKKGS